MNKVTIQVTNCESSQEWTSDPDMIEVHLTASFLQLAQKCIDFMKENEFNYMCKWFSLGYEFFANTNEDSVVGDVLDENQRNGNDGYIYEIFQPEYRVEGCHAKIFADGDIQAIFPFKNTSEELFCTIGNFNDLKLKFSFHDEAKTA